MIEYPQHALGVFSLTRIHGSAVLQAALPAALSSIGLYLWVEIGDYEIDKNKDERPIDHPYAVGIIIVAFTFLITFRANLGYNRYWEAATAVHQMLSKWLDVVMQLAAFHRQCNKYDDCRPPAFGDHPHLGKVSVSRVRRNLSSPKVMKEQLSQLSDSSPYHYPKRSYSMWANQQQGDINAPGASPPSPLRIPVPNLNARQHGYRDYDSTAETNHEQQQESGTEDRSPLTELTRLKVKVKLDGGIKEQYPSLFLQECSHLMSLLSAVAMSTLRNDIEGVETPLIQYIPGSPWPPADPDQLSPEIRKAFHFENIFVKLMRSFFGSPRDATVQTLYNAARPFRVLGGVSDAEIQLLQKARGPCAKVALCSLWMQEFICREYLGGSVGEVSPAILSRLIQETSDGMLLYHQARKVAYVPFPFPHAQMASIFTIVVMVFVPVIMFSFVNKIDFACVLNFFTVLCFEAVHQVARELENPFKNVPNDLPLTTFQAQFNEALITVYAGFHPDAWWEVPQAS